MQLSEVRPQLLGRGYGVSLAYFCIVVTVDHAGERLRGGGQGGDAHRLRHGCQLSTQATPHRHALIVAGSPSVQCVTACDVPRETWITRSEG